MSSTEKYAWGSLITTGLIYLYFQMRLLDGWSVVETSPKSLIATYFTIVVMFIVAEAVIGGFTSSGRKGAIEKDERDRAIETRAEQFSNWFMVAAINVIVFHVIALEAYPNSAFEALNDALRLDTPTRIFFVLFTVLVGATIVQRISTLVMYRLGSEPNAI